MKKLFIPLTLSMYLLLSSCVIFFGHNYNNSKKATLLKIGMTKEEAVDVMGSHYYIESASDTEDGILEVLKYYSASEIPYLLFFLNDVLVEFHKYIPPPAPPVLNVSP
ncbi:MAG: hypothetical protein GX963_00245 [Bacteroidales bacterium]|nr:hypothetical protein [Bacteroidales bacterium]